MKNLTKSAWIEMIVSQAIRCNVETVLAILVRLFCHYAGVKQYGPHKEWEYRMDMESALSDYLCHHTQEDFQDLVRDEILSKAIGRIRLYCGQWNRTLQPDGDCHLYHKKEAHRCASVIEAEDPEVLRWWLVKKEHLSSKEVEQFVTAVNTILDGKVPERYPTWCH